MPAEAARYSGNTTETNERYCPAGQKRIFCYESVRSSVRKLRQPGLRRTRLHQGSAQRILVGEKGHRRGQRQGRRGQVPRHRPARLAHAGFRRACRRHGCRPHRPHHTPPLRPERAHARFGRRPRARPLRHGRGHRVHEPHPRERHRPRHLARLRHR